MITMQMFLMVVGYMTVTSLFMVMCFAVVAGAHSMIFWMLQKFGFWVPAKDSRSECAFVMFLTLVVYCASFVLVINEICTKNAKNTTITAK